MGTKLEWFTKNGFNEDGITYCVIGDSYAIKDKLKESGYKYSTLLRWHAAAPIELPEGYSHITISFYDIYEWNDQWGMAFFFETSKDKVEQKFLEAEGGSDSEYVGEIGDKLTNIAAVYKSAHGYSDAYGYKYIYTFDINGNTLIWITTTSLTIPTNIPILLSGTIKTHKMYRGQKQTYLTRCSIKQVEENANI
jgi:hypothetical protein